MYNIKKIVLVFAQSRSGHHAVIDWLFNQYKSDKLFFNYNDPLKFDPLFPDRVQYYLNDKKYYRVISNSWIESGLVDKKKQEFEQENDVCVNTIENKDKNLIILNYENIKIENISKIYDSIRMKFPKSKIYKVFVIRDLLNLVASKIKSGKEISLEDIKENSDKIEDIINLWRDYCKYSLNGNDNITVAYNKWFLDNEYREALLQKIDSDFKNSELPNISTFGGGSSFDGFEQNKRPEELKVLERWRDYSSYLPFMNLWYYDDVSYYTEILFNKNIYIN